eukprot:3560682-Amphidinium_carterae.2
MAEHCAFAPSWFTITWRDLNVSMNLIVSLDVLRTCRATLARLAMELRHCMHTRHGIRTAILGQQGLWSNREINAALRQVMPGCQWTSLANIKAGDVPPHRDSLNLQCPKSHVWELLRCDARMLVEHDKGKAHGLQDPRTQQQVTGVWRNISSHACCFD